MGRAAGGTIVSEAKEPPRDGKPARRRKAPANTEWRGDTLHGRKRIKGTLHRWSLRTGDVDVARERVAKDIKKLEAIAFGGARITYEDAFAGWAENIGHQVGSPKTAKRYAVSLKQMEPQLLGSFLDEIDKGKVDAIVTARRAAGVTTATIRRDLTALSSVLIHAETATNPALDRLEKLKEKRDPIVLPELAHVRRVIERCPGRLAALVGAALTTGCRQEELVTTERAKLDHVRRQLSVKGKGNKIRTIALSGAAYELLRAQPAHLRCKWLFWHGDGEPYRNVASRFSALVREVFAAAYDVAHGTTEKTRPSVDQLVKLQDRHDWADIGFRAFTFHHLRHYFAVDYLKSHQGTIYDLQQHLGHESVKTTEIYLKYLTAEEKRGAMYGTGTPAAAVIERGA
jgi:integrase/recombinase XerD